MDENMNPNEIKYDPVTGEPISSEVEIGQVDPQVKMQYEQHFSAQPMQPQPVQNMYNQLAQPQTAQNMYNQPVQPQPVQNMYNQSVQPQTAQNMYNQPVQPQMNQQMYNQQMVPPLTQQQMYAQPLNQQPQLYVPPKTEEMHPDNTDPNAKKLLLWSLVLFIVAHVSPYISELFQELDSIGDFSFSGTASILGAMIYIASFVLMIILRVKYPHNKNGKILMIVMIVELVLAIVGIILLIIACASILEACGGMGFIF